MVMKKIITKTLSKTKFKQKLAMAEANKLRKKGFKNVYFTDFKTVGRGSKIKGVGTKVEAFKGRRKTPKGFRTKTEEF